MSELDDADRVQTVEPAASLKTASQYPMKLFIKSILCLASVATLGAGSLYAAEKKDLVDTAVAAGTFKTLAAALQAAGLVETMKGEGPFTVFAPTDEAFAKLPEGSVEKLLKPENKEKLVEILTYHVVAGAVPSEAALKLTEATALNQKKLALSVKDGALFINEAKVVTADLSCSNGVIHVIDSVMLPPLEKK